MPKGTFHEPGLAFHSSFRRYCTTQQYPPPTQRQDDWTGYFRSPGNGYGSPERHASVSGFRNKDGGPHLTTEEMMEQVWIL